MGSRATVDPSDKGVVLPKALWHQVREHVAPRRQRRFIVEAVEEKLAREAQHAALDDSAGCWRDADHPELRDDAAIDRWLGELRRSWDAQRLSADSLGAMGGEPGQVPPG